MKPFPEMVTLADRGPTGGAWAAGCIVTMKDFAVRGAGAA
jgi:hypothetical protein